jgi:hypothetical protein
MPSKQEDCAEYLKQTDRCDRCETPRKLAFLVYNQDLRIIGAEKDPKDLEALCLRCHEIETLGRTDLREIPPYSHCEHCKKPVWDFACDHGVEALCADCTFMLYGVSPRAITSPRLEPNEEGNLEPGMHFWKSVIRQILWMIHKDDVQKAVELTIDCLEHDDPGRWFLEMGEIPSREGFVRAIWDKYKTDSRSAWDKNDEKRPSKRYVN